MRKPRRSGASVEDLVEVARRVIDGEVYGLKGHPFGAPLDEDAAEHFVIDVVTGKLERQQIASGLVRFAA